MQKTFEKHWTRADRAEAAGDFNEAAKWLEYTQAQLQRDTQYAHPSILKSIEAQRKRVLAQQGVQA